MPLYTYQNMGAILLSKDQVDSAEAASAGMPSGVINPQSVKGDQQIELLTAAKSLMDQAPYRSALRRIAFDGMRQDDPPVVMWSPASGWRFVDYDGYRVELLVSCGLDQESPEAERCFVRVASNDTADESFFEFYARVYGNGQMTYRTEQRGDLPPELARFVQMLGVDPCVYRRGEDRGSAVRSGDMAASERPFLPGQASKLAKYMVA